MSADDTRPDLSGAPAVPGVTRWRKKPVEIEARLFDPGADYDEACDVMLWCGAKADDEGCEIGTLEGVMLARPGDWIIKGVQGEFYPCKPGVFAATYEPAGAPAAASPSPAPAGPPASVTGAAGGGWWELRLSVSLPPGALAAAQALRYGEPVDTYTWDYVAEAALLAAAPLIRAAETARAEAAEAKLATLAAHNRGHLELPGSCCPHLAQENLAVIGSEEARDA